MEAAAEGEAFFYSMFLLGLYVMCPLSVVSLQFLTAPYGKHLRPGYGPTIPAPVAWFLMESPTLWLTLLLYPRGRHRSHPLSLLLISTFLLHYIHRTLLFPLRLQRQNNANVKNNIHKPLPLTVVLMAFAFNLLNSYVQTRSVSHFSDYGGVGPSAGVATRVLVGLAVFGWGMWVNVTSDMELLRLKREGGGGYKIPRGGWFEAVACPNYMGEMAEWLGWGIMSWTPAALGFFLSTCSNLIPRAVANRRWYVDKFGEDYPKAKKAVVPFIF